MFIKSALKMSDDIPKIRYIYYRCVYGFYKIMYAILTKCIDTCTYDIYAIEREILISSLTAPPPFYPNSNLCLHSSPLGNVSFTYTHISYMLITYILHILL